MHCGVISFRRKITRDCIPDREGHKKTRIYFASSSPLVSLLFVSFFCRSVPGVFPYLISFFISASFPSPIPLHYFFSSLCLFFSHIHWFRSASFCEICDSILHADSVVASQHMTFILLPLRKLSWCASPGVLERNVTFLKTSLGCGLQEVMCHLECARGFWTD